MGRYELQAYTFLLDPDSFIIFCLLFAQWRDPNKEMQLELQQKNISSDRDV